MQVPMNPAERLLNFIVHNTDLYMRTKRNETPQEHDARWTTAFQKLSPWLQSFREQILKEEAKKIELCKDAAKACIDIFKDYDETEINVLPLSIQFAWKAGKYLLEKESNDNQDKK